MIQGVSKTPYWLNMDNFTASCKKLSMMLKKVYDNIPKEKPKNEDDNYIQEMCTEDQIEKE